MLHTRFIDSVPLLGCFAWLAAGPALAQIGEVGRDTDPPQVLGAAPADLDLTAQQQSIVELARASKATSGVSVMAASAPLALAQALANERGGPALSAGQITLALNETTYLTALRTNSEVRPDMGVWRGVIEGSGGSVTIVWWPDGRLVGTVQHAGSYYSIRPLGERLHAVVEMKEDQMPPEHAPLMLVASNTLLRHPNDAGPMRPLAGSMRAFPAQRPGMQTKSRQLPLGQALREASVSPDDVTIDIIVAYTKKAAGHYGDIKRDLVDLAVEEANESFRTSNLGHIKLRLVHAYATDYQESGHHFDHVWRLADKGDGHLEEVHGLRDKYRADVVVLIVDDPEGCGLATRVYAEADEAFAVVHHECAATTYSLAHEIGHLFGARHDPSMDKITTPFPYGRGYVNGFKWRDIMSYKESCGGCPRLPVWSSPTVFIKGEPAGTEDLNNARVIAEQAVRVAAFR